MLSRLLIAIIAFSFPLSAQIYDSDEPTQQSPVVAEDTVSDELPPPLPEGIATRPVPAAARVELVPTSGENLDGAKKLAGMGAGLYFVGLGISRGIALPLEISATDQEMAIVSEIIDLAATGFKISGATRNGIGASIAYNSALRRGLEPDRNINWGFYKAGWAFSTVSTLMYWTLSFGVTNGMDYGTAVVVNTIRLTSGIASDVMWAIGVINSLKYTRTTRDNCTEHSGVTITPVYSSLHKSFGAVAGWSF